MLTTEHWELVLSDRGFMRALITTLTMASTTAVVSPLLFSIVAYVLVRTKWPGRAMLDGIFWMSAAIPGILAGLGLLIMFLNTPFLSRYQWYHLRACARGDSAGQADLYSDAQRCFHADGV